MFKLGIITDEITQDLEKALIFASERNLDCFELRSAWEKGPFEFSDDDFNEIKRLSDKYSIPLVSISSPFYKCSYFDEDTRKKHIEGLKRLIDKAEFLGVSQIRCFDFFKDSNITLDMIAEAYEEPIKLCKDRGITLLLESEPSANSFDCKSVADTVRHINNDCVKALYEPGNDIYSCTEEIPFPDGYECVKDIYCHVHIKDAIRRDGKTVGVAIGSGEVAYEAMFREFADSGYEGAVVLEPHYKPSGEISEELLKNPKGSMFSEGGFIASEECINAVNRILNRIVKDE
jgi:sugar phosphate isomerase/epimerase